MLVSHLGNVEVIIFTPKEIEGYSNVVPAYERKGDDFSEVLRVIKRMGGVDIIHVQHEYGIFGKGDGLIKLIKELKSENLIKSAVITMHSVWTNYRDTSFQRQLNVFDAVIVHSNCQLFELVWQGVNNTYLIPHGTIINPYLEYRDEIRREMGVEDKYIVLVPGFVRKDKNVDKVVKVVNEVGMLPLVAGEVKDQVDLSGAMVINKYLERDEMLKLYAASDVIVFYYKDHRGVYSVSGALHMAMGSFRPILGTAVPRLTELMSVPETIVRDLEDLKKKLIYIRENEEEYLNIMSPIFRYAIETSWERVAKKHLNLYKMLIENDRDRNP